LHRLRLTDHVRIRVTVTDFARELVDAFLAFRDFSVVSYDFFGDEVDEFAEIFTFAIGEYAKLRESLLECRPFDAPVCEDFLGARDFRSRDLVVEVAERVDGAVEVLAAGDPRDDHVLESGRTFSDEGLLIGFQRLLVHVRDVLEKAFACFFTNEFLGEWILPVASLIVRIEVTDDAAFVHEENFRRKPLRKDRLQFTDDVNVFEFFPINHKSSLRDAMRTDTANETFLPAPQRGTDPYTAYRTNSINF
jgi:hypothetical protein